MNKVQHRLKKASVQPQGGSQKPKDCQLRFVASDLDEAWVQQCAQALTLVAMLVEALQMNSVKLVCTIFNLSCSERMRCYWSLKIRKKCR